MEDQGKPYISLYVPSSGGEQFGHPVKFSVITVRRGWNKLSRLQKSVLLMSICVLLGFSFVLALSWSTTTTTTAAISSNGNGDILVGPSRYQYIERNEGYRARSRTQNGPRRKPFLQLPGEKNPSTEPRRRFDWELPKKFPKDDLQTVPRVLSPDIDYPFKPIMNEEDAQRSEIPLELITPSAIKPRPVIDRINKPIDGVKIKFDGPRNSRQQAVVDAFLHAWKGYRKYAWGQDHLKPISGGGQDWFGLGLTLIDSLDTMYIMNLENEFNEARDWVTNKLSFDVAQNVNLFETTIRVLGGLLSAYHLSGDPIFLKKAQELGSILVVGFDSPSGIPYSDISLRSKSAHGPAWNPDSTTSEVSTIQLEFRDLSRITNVTSYEESAMNVSKHIHKLPKLQGLVPIHITPSTGNFRSTAAITLGARGDSYYEYLLKQWIQTGKTIDFLRDDYLAAVEGMKNLLLRRTKVSNLTFVGELENGGRNFKPKMDHLVCYLPGTLALGVSHGLPEWHMDFAKSLLYTCYQTYKRQPTGLSPEITMFRTEDDSEMDFYVKSNDAHNLLRPETVESLWYLYQITGDSKYQEWGWEIFQSFLKYCKVQYGFTSISSVLNPENTQPRDIMESFFLGETLKYFYLLFSDKPIFDLNAWVFNTEAHPFPARDQ